ncbi:MAG: hypothetical protein ACRDPW_00985 [Mycobacteriales bacterium]
MTAIHVYRLPRFLTRGRRRVAITVPVELADAALEALEDAEDIEEARKARAEGGPRYSHESIKAELGLV